MLGFDGSAVRRRELERFRKQRGFTEEASCRNCEVHDREKLEGLILRTRTWVYM